jgi:hypothetical protein
LAFNPEHLPSQSRHGSKLTNWNTPLLLRSPLPDHDPIDPLREHSDVIAMHAQWQKFDSKDRTDRRQRASHGLRARLRDRIAKGYSQSMKDSERDSLALTADIIRAVDAVAGRCDALASRIQTLEESLREVVDTLGADLVQLRATLESMPNQHHVEPPSLEDPGE